jgi:hypothetical protein
MGFKEVYFIVKNSGIFNDERDLRYSFNKIRIHNKNETIEHFMSKAMLTFLIFSKLGKGVITEADMRCGRQVDVVQFSNAGEITGYEIESNAFDKTEIKGMDIVEIKLANMPAKAKEGLEELEKWLKEYLI